MKKIFTCLTKKSILALYLLLLPSLLVAGNDFSGHKIAEEALDPCCSVPHDTQIDCDDLPYDFNPYDVYDLQALFGVPVAHYGCTLYSWFELEPEVNLDNCNIGTITRRFQLYVPTNYGDPYVVCTQLVTINAAHNYEIRFPPDATAYCEEPEAEDLTFNELGCDLLAVSVTDLIFNISSDACYKVLRKYRVINWCEYDGISPPIKINRDEDCDGAPGDEAVWLLRRPDGTVFIDRDNNENNNDPSLAELDVSCGHDGITGYWRSFELHPAYPYYGNRGFWEYTQHIKVMDDVKPEIQFDAPDPFCSLSSNIDAGCPGPVEIPFSVTEDCSDEITVKVFLFAFNEPVPLTPDNNIAGNVLSGSFPNYTISGSFPIGEHTFELHVEDGCGNTNSVAIPFEVVDCLAPAPVCISGLSSGLMPAEPGTDADGDGDVDPAFLEIWATDFLASPVSDCSPPIKYSINIQGETPDIDQSGLVITCEDGDLVIVEIYAWDSAFNPYAVQPDGVLGGPNYDHCTTWIMITNFDSGICNEPAPVSVAGLIMTELDSMLEATEVHLSGGANDMMMTGQDGHFEFDELEVGDDYTLTPIKDGDDKNGISTIDLIRLGKHLAGIDTLNTPYQLIAADVDSSGFIDQTDLDELRRLVLNLDSALLHNSSWRFVDMAYEFPDPEDPWLEEFPESITMESINQNYDSLDFRAIKIGDLNGSASHHEGEASLAAGIDLRTDEDLFVLQSIDHILRSGETATVAIEAPALADIEGCQFTFEFDPAALSLTDIEYGLALPQHLGTTHANEGMLTVSWDVYSNTLAFNGEDKNRLLTLAFTANREVRLSELVRLSSQKIKVEAYRKDGALLDMALLFTDPAEEGHAFNLYQNEPNPFGHETFIRFYLPGPSQATLGIMDVNGRLLKMTSARYDAGNHQLRLEAEDLPANGILYYFLEVDGERKVKKMVRME